MPLLGDQLERREMLFAGSMVGELLCPPAPIFIQCRQWDPTVCGGTIFRSLPHFKTLYFCHQTKIWKHDVCLCEAKL